jgi:hypothetical protein
VNPDDVVTLLVVWWLLVYFSMLYIKATPA